MKVGFTRGVYDLFHIGHLNLLRNAKSLCDKLIVGVKTDDFTSQTKKKPVVAFNERLDIVRSCKYVDLAIPCDTFDFVELQKKLKFDVVFVGDDWFGSDRFSEMEEKLKPLGVEIVYLPRTQSTSSTLLTNVLNKINED